jgi:hypothetical protein
VAATAAPDSEGGGWGRTVLFAAIAAGASYFGVTALFGTPAAAPTAAPAAPTVPAPLVVPVSSASPAAAAAKLAITTSESPLPPGGDVPAGHGLLEIQVPDGTAIRVDGEYLGMGPARRVPLKPGQHQLVLADGDAQTVTIKVGQRTLAAARGPAGTP